MMHEIVGVTHLHSDYSYDGNISVQEMAQDACMAGLDFIMVTDHHTLQAKKDGLEGWHEFSGRPRRGRTAACLVIVGEEISPRHDHYLAFGITDAFCAPRHHDRPQEYISAVRAAGGAGFIAHPDQKGAPYWGLREYGWQDWSVSDYDGMSVWDLQTDWQGRLGNFAGSLYAYLFPRRVLTGPCPETLRRWDEIAARRPLTGFAELDNHNRHAPAIFGSTPLGRMFPIFSFPRAFRTLRNHILLETPLERAPADAGRVIKAFASGRMFFSNDGLADSRGFRTWLELPSGPGSGFIAGSTAGVLVGEPAAAGPAAWPGDSAPFAPGTKLFVNSPRNAWIKIFRDGKKVFETWGWDAQWPLPGPGVYRVALDIRSRLSWKPWVFVNPFRVGMR